MRETAGDYTLAEDLVAEGFFFCPPHVQRVAIECPPVLEYSSKLISFCNKPVHLTCYRLSLTILCTCIQVQKYILPATRRDYNRLAYIIFHTGH